MPLDAPQQKRLIAMLPQELEVRVEKKAWKKSSYAPPRPRIPRLNDWRREVSMQIASEADDLQRRAKGRRASSTRTWSAKRARSRARALREGPIRRGDGAGRGRTREGASAPRRRKLVNAKVAPTNRPRLARTSERANKEWARLRLR